MSRISGNLTVEGRLVPKELTIPDDTIRDDAVAADAGIGAEKMEQEHKPVYAQESATTAVAETRTVAVIRGATGTIEDFRAGSLVPCTGDATITVDLLKNGTSVLNAAIVLDSSNSARVPEAATVAPGSASLVAGDVLEVAVTVSAGTGTLGQGVFAAATYREDPVA